MKKFVLSVLCLGFIAAVGVPSASAQQRFEVTVTNLTRGQVFTPILVASHREGVKLFYPGQPASLQLEDLAESGNPAPLAAMLNAMPEVGEVTNSGAVLPPGQSVTQTVMATGSFSHVSVAAMLVPTNDAFFAVNGVEGPPRFQTLPGFGGIVFPNTNTTVTVLSPAYDAGTEANDESCDTIPGPPTVCTGEGVNLSREGAEGYVHVQAGIHGIGDLDPAERDWRNPVARIVIRRIP